MITWKSAPRRVPYPGLHPDSSLEAMNASATTAGACWTKSAGLDGDRDPRDEVGLVAAEVRAAFRTLR
jgi:hypothetical protein